jgi:NAD(P)-dependent dehydrogenase (short-subunit alcohol dehydrogenase family)
MTGASMPDAKQVCIVTGAANDGIGEAVTRRLSKEGYVIYGTYESELKSKAQKIGEELPGVTMFEVDHSSRDSLLKFVNSVSAESIHGLVNVQMFFAMEDPNNFDHDLWDRSLAINLTAPNFLIHSFKPRYVSGSSIVTVTSTEAFIGSFGASAYAATKAAIHNLTKTHANNLGASKVRVNVVAPGWIGGAMDTDEVFNMSREITPLGRLGSPDEVAATVNFLFSPESSFINGTVIVVDGGYTGSDTISKFEFNEEMKKNKAHRALFFHVLRGEKYGRPT